MKAPQHRRIAPRLANGEKRIPAGNGLPPLVKHALTALAAQHGESRSWAIEQIILQWAEGDPLLHKLLKGGIDYVPRKSLEPDRPRTRAREHELRVVKRRRVA